MAAAIATLGVVLSSTFVAAAIADAEPLIQVDFEQESIGNDSVTLTVKGRGHRFKDGEYGKSLFLDQSDNPKAVQGLSLAIVPGSYDPDAEYEVSFDGMTGPNAVLFAEIYISPFAEEKVRSAATTQEARRSRFPWIRAEKRWNNYRLFFTMPSNESRKVTVNIQLDLTNKKGSKSWCMIDNVLIRRSSLAKRTLYAYLGTAASDSRKERANNLYK